jgi:hypothetical protein
MKNTFSSAIAGALTTVIALAAVSAAAHHSHVMFDATAEQTITGTVKSFAFQNPHVYLFVNVADGGGPVTTYVVEMSYVQNMISHGISRETFKPGDQVSVKMNPLRDGRPGGSYVTVSKDGREFGRGAEQ